MSGLLKKERRVHTIGWPGALNTDKEQNSVRNGLWNCIALRRSGNIREQQRLLNVWKEHLAEHEKIIESDSESPSGASVVAFRRDFAAIWIKKYAVTRYRSKHKKRSPDWVTSSQSKRYKG